jgi:hypothetical protein
MSLCRGLRDINDGLQSKFFSTLRKTSAWIRIQQQLDLDPDPVSAKCLDPDPKSVNPDPKHWLWTRDDLLLSKPYLD